MKSDEKYSSLFDDDFEVTYEEELPVYEDREPIQRLDTASFIDTDEDISDSYDDTTEIRSRRKKRHRSVPLAAPIRKGGKALSKISGTIIRQLTLLLILAISIYVMYNFWRSSALYGDIIAAVRAKEIPPALASYFSVGALFLLFELLSLLWSMTRTRVRERHFSWKEDTGRGLFSFVFVFLTSYLSFLLYRFLPESPDALLGLKGALEVYGSLHNILFGLCLAGVVSCLIRKYKPS